MSDLVFYGPPVDAPLSTHHGDWLDFGNGRYQHRGVDFKIGAGNPYYCPAPGKSVRFTNDGSFGRFAMCIEHDHVSDSFRFSLCAHGSALYVAIGERVDAGQVLGLTGHEGDYPNGAPIGYADHLHWQLSDSPTFPVAFEHSIDPMALVLTEVEMDRLQKLEEGLARAERLLGGNAVNIECYPGWEDLVGVPGGFPVNTIPCQLQDDGWKAAPGSPTYILTGEPALIACDRRGFSFPLGLRSTQVAQNKHQSDGHGGN